MMCRINNTIFIEKPQRQAAPNFNRYIAENIDTLPEVTYKISDNDGSSRLQRDWSVWCNVKGGKPHSRKDCDTLEFTATANNFAITFAQANRVGRPRRGNQMSREI